MGLTAYDIKRILRPKKDDNVADDFRMIDSWPIFEDGKDVNKRNLKYLCYELETINPDTGEKYHFYKAIKFCRVIRLPKDAKQSTSFMDKHAQVLSAVWELDINLITVIANIIEPVPLGLLYLYGVQGTGYTIEEAQEKAHKDYISFVASMQGTYRVLEMRCINAQETEWLREKMYNMEYMTVVRGIPKASHAGEDAGNKGLGGKNLNPDSQGTLEEIISGMVDYEYVIQILSTPVYTNTLKEWSRKTEKDMTDWYGQMQGTKALSFSLSIPMMFMSNQSSSQGWNKAYTDANSVNYSHGESFNTSYGENIGQSLSQSFGQSYGQSQGTTVSDSYSQSHSVSQGTSFGQTVGQSFGSSQNVSLSTGNSLSHSTGFSQGESNGLSYGTSENMSLSQGQSTSHSTGLSAGSSQGLSQGGSYNVSNGESMGNSHSLSSSQSIGLSNSTSVGNSTGYSVGNSTGSSVSQSLGNSYSTSTGQSTGSNSGYSSGNSGGFSWNTGANAGTSDGTSYNEGTSKGTNGTLTLGGGYIPVGFNIGTNGGSSITNGSNTGVSTGLSGSSGGNYGWSEGNSMGYSNSNSLSVSSGNSASVSNGLSNSTSQSVSNSSSLSNGFSTSQSYGGSESYGVNNGNSLSESWGVNQSTSESINIGQNSSDGYGSSIGLSTGYGSSAGSSYSANIGSSSSDGYGSSTSMSNGYGVSQSVSSSQSLSQSVSESYGVSQGKSIGNSYSESVSESTSQGTSQSYGQSQSVGQGQSYSEGSGTSQSLSTGASGAYVSGTSSSMGLGPSIGYNKSYQWLDQQVKDIIELLEFQNERIKKALRGEGAFYTYVYIACPSQDALSAAQAAAKSTWQNEFAYTNPIQVLNLTDEEQQHLLYHFTAFSTDVSRERVGGVEEFKYATVLLPNEFVAYTHLPRISEGGVFTEINDVPKFSVPSLMKGEIYMGTILSAERYSLNNGYKTPFSYRLDESELMHGFFTGASRSGKTVAAMRFIAELAQVKRKKTGKRMRIVCMDPKQDWRTLARFVEPERFKFFSMAKPDFFPLHLNPLKIPRGVEPQFWIDGLIDIYCRAYGLLERGKQMMGETIYALYEEEKVFEARKEVDDPSSENYGKDWRDLVSDRSSRVTFERVYKHMETIKAQLEDPSNPKGKAGNDTRDAYARLLDRLQAFNRPFSIEHKLFAKADGMSVDELIGKDDVTVLESLGLENTFSNFIFGIITSGFYKYAIAHEGGFLADDQYETLLVIEEANKVLTGNDAAGSSGGSSMSVSGQSEFETILDQAAGYGLFIMAITQTISAMPRSIIANSGLVFAGRLKAQDDIVVVIHSIAREERFDDRDLLKWFPRCPTGWFVCQSSRTFDFKDSEPILVAIAPLNMSAPSNLEIKELMGRRKMHEKLEKLNRSNCFANAMG